MVNNLTMYNVSIMILILFGTMRTARPTAWPTHSAFHFRESLSDADHSCLR